MASLALGVIGGLAGGPIGYMIGSTIGNLLFPPKGPDGPRLTDLHLQSSAYGQMIPIPYGAIRLPGQVVWQTDLTEHAHHSGGKGGPTSTTYTYTASFAVKICKGPLQQIRRIWADSRLLYSAVVGDVVDNGSVPVTLYLGLETANPDPTMESILGVGFVPAFRDDAAVVFTDLDLSTWGNRLPNLNFEVVTNAGDIPYRISTFTPTLQPTVGVTGVTYDETTQTITTANYIHHFAAPYTYSQRSYLIDGTATGTDYDGVVETNYNPTIVASNADIAFATYSGNSTRNAFLVAGLTATLDVPNPWGGINSNTVTGPMAVIADPDGTKNLYAVGSNNSAVGGVAKFGLGPTGIPASTPAFLVGVTASSPSDINFVISDDGFVWIKVHHGTGLNDLYKYDSTLTLVHHWLPADVPVEFDDGYTQGIYNGMIVFQGVHAAQQSCIVYTINSDNTFTFVGEIPQGLGNNTPLGNGLFVGIDGVISLNPPLTPITLASIVDNISDRCGQPDRDTSALTDLVPGYAITAQMTGRDAITPLQSAYFFDGVESSTEVKFIKRGASSIVSISDDDLAAQADAGDPPPVLTTVRMQEEDLPQHFDYSYINKDADYQTGNQTASRQITRSQNKVSIQVAIAMADQTAKDAVEKLLYNAWVEREQYTILLPRKYAYLEPTDIIEAHGATMRIVNKNEVASGVIEIQGYASDPAVWLGSFVGAASTGFSPVLPPNPTTTSSTASAVLLDIPLIDDDDSPAGFYAASDSVKTLYRSTDGGTNYTQIATLVASSIGSTSSVLGDWTGGNIFDEGNSVTVVLTGGELSSTTELAVLNGANEAVIGNEIVQFKNATLTATNTYVLTGLLRGRRGTEFATNAHISGERFVLLPVTNVPGSVSDINQPRLYKALSPGDTLASISPITFTNTGAGLRPYSPVLPGGGPDTSGNVIINWTRRTRTGGAWLPNVDASLGELTEQYVVQIWDSTYTNCARVITATSQTCTYTSAQQVTDFGSQQQTIYCTIGQLGQVGLGIQTKAAIPGAGGSNSAVIAPTTPYNSPPAVTTGCTLPTQNNTIVWASPTTQTYLGFSPGTEWVIKFTTPSSFGGTTQATLSGAEYPVDGSQPTNRVAVLSTSPCGSPLSTACSVSGFTITIPTFTPGHNPMPTYYPTLQPSTDYYLSITTDAPSTMFVNLVHN